MSQNIAFESMFLVHSILMGIIITSCYDVLQIFRKVIKHGKFLISLEDFIFWIICSIFIFLMLFKENNGTLRWFTIGGATLGMLIYKNTVSPYIVCFMSTVINKTIHLVCWLLKLLLTPVFWVLSTLSCKIKIICKYLKKRLTVCIKLVKITLCKHRKKEW